MTRDTAWVEPGQHDVLHPVTIPSNDWTETAWFAWLVPERSLAGYFYPVFRPTLGIQTGGLLVFDDGGELPWELPFFAFGQLFPLEEQLDLRDATLANGMTLRCIRPGTAFDFGFSGPELQLELRFEAVVPPLVTLGTPPFEGAGHLDQAGHVTGTMVLHGEEISVDCFAMRDRGWGPRRFRRGTSVGYSYATASPSSAFLTIVSRRRGEEPVTSGYLVRDGEWARVVSGDRIVQRDAEGRTSAVRVRAVDDQGRELEVVGAVVSRQAFTPYPTMLCWNAMMRWELDGVTCWGEDQDVWHPVDWRNARRSRT
jgi:hypothetical protein